MVLDLGINGHTVINGHFVSEKVSQVVQAINEYDPDIEVQYIPVGARREGAAAYRLVYRPLGAEPYIMFTVRRDEDMDERILQKIIQNDQRNGTTTLSEYEAWEESQRLVERQRYLDSIEEANDMAYHALKTHKNVYKINDDITIRDYGNNVRK